MPDKHDAHVTLGDCARVLSGGTPSKGQASYWGGTIPWLSAKDMKSFFISDTEDHLTEAGAENGTKAIDPGSILVLARGMTLLHDIPICFAKRRLTFNQDVKGVVPHSHVDGRFLAYALLAAKPYLLSSVELAGHGTGRLPTDRLTGLPIWLPTWAEQRAIAEVLGALDDKIDLNRRMNETLEEMARSLFDSVCLSPQSNSNKLRVRELVDNRALLVGDGYRAKRSELAEEGLPFARAGNINGGFHFDGAELLGLDGVQKAGVKLSQPGDVVFTSKGTVGRFALVAETTPAFVYSPQLCFWRSLQTSLLRPAFLFSWMQSRHFMEQVAAVKGQTDMADYVSLRDQWQMTIELPSASTQTAFAERVDPLLARTAANVAQSETLKALRDSLLPKLLSGEIRIKDAEKLVGEAT